MTERSNKKSASKKDFSAMLKGKAREIAKKGGENSRGAGSSPSTRERGSE